MFSSPFPPVCFCINSAEGGERPPKSDKNPLCLTLKKRTRLKSGTLASKAMKNGKLFMLMQNRVDIKNAAIL
jgi:hypothetical protein